MLLPAFGRVREPSDLGAGCVATGDRSRQADLVSPFLSGDGGPDVGFALPGVAYLRLSRSDGSVLTAPVARIAGYGLYTFPDPGRPAITGWKAYRADGTLLGRGTGNPAGRQG